MDCLNPNAASGGFILVALVVAFVLGMVAYRGLLSSKYAAKVKELEAKAAELDDKRRG